MTKPIRHTLLALATVSCSLASVAQDHIETHLPLAEVQNSLAQQGPTPTLKKYFPCDSDSNMGYEDVSGGDPRWLALAAAMVEQADNCHAEELVDAIGQAMTQAPQNALPLVNSSERLSAENICLPFIPDVLPVEEQLRQVHQTKTAINGVQDAGLQKQKRLCLSFIEEVEQAISAQQAPH